ncbi:MAG: hypothetical protein AAGA08_16735 [Pseudomonadota bacterium]
MRSLIKSSESVASDEVRTLNVGAPNVPPLSVKTNEPPVDGRDQMISDLRAELSDLRADREALLAEWETEREKLVLEAEERGEARARDAGDMSAELLRVAIEKAESLCRDEFGNLEVFALEAGRSALSALFAEPDRYFDFVENIILKQMKDLSSQTQMEIRVSGHDFEGGAKLDALKSNTGVAHISVDPILPAGEAILKPRLGQIDVSAPDQFEAVLSVLNDHVHKAEMA